MPGGKSNIKPEDGKQFSSEYQPQEKWTEKRALELADDLIAWLNAKDEDGEDKGNMFYEEFLIIERNLYPDLPRYLRNKFSSFSERIRQAEKIQELKLQKYGVGDRLNASMTKFVLANKHGWKERQDHTTNEKSINWHEVKNYRIDDKEKGK